MTKELREKLEALRAGATRVNEATNNAGELVKEVERFLNDTLGLGVPGQTKSVDEKREPGDEAAEPTRCYYLAYDRMPGDTFRIHVVARLEARGVNAEWTVLDETQIPWSSCPRQLKLRAFAALPDLLEVLTSNAKTLADEAEKAQSAIGELMSALGNQTKAAPVELTTEDKITQMLGRKTETLPRPKAPK
jgi:hypothetical protein